MSLPTNPQSRSEEYLNAIATGDASNLPEPESRMDEYLDYIAKNGGGGGGSSLPEVTADDKDKYLHTNASTGDLEWSAVSGGTTVVANPTLAGTEADLTGLQVGDTKYKVGGSSGGGVLVVHDVDGTLDKTYQEIEDAGFSVCKRESLSQPGIYNYFWQSLIGYMEGYGFGVLYTSKDGETEGYSCNAKSDYPQATQ